MKKLFLLTAGVLFTVFTFAQDAAEKLSQAQEAIKAKDYAKAYSLYDAAMNNLGDVQVDVSINFNIGYAACKSGNIEGAEKYMGKAIEAKVNVSKCHETLGDMYADKDDIDKALACYDKAIAADAGGADAMAYKAAGVAYKGGKYDNAASYFDICIEKGYKGETAYLYKASALKKQDKDADYQATLEAGVAKFPKDDKLTGTLAKIYVGDGNDLYKKGVAILNDANQQVTDGKMTTEDDTYKAEVKKSKDELNAAVAILEKAKVLDASNKNVQTLLDACKAAMQ